MHANFHKSSDRYWKIKMGKITSRLKMLIVSHRDVCARGIFYYIVKIVFNLTHISVSQTVHSNYVNLTQDEHVRK